MPHVRTGVRGTKMMGAARRQIYLNRTKAAAEDIALSVRSSDLPCRRHDPTPKITLRCFGTIDLHIQATLVKSDDLARIQLHAPAQRAARVRRDREIRNDRATHAWKRTHGQVRSSRNCQQPAERTLERELATVEHGGNGTNTRAIGARSDQAWSWREPELDGGGGRGPEQHGEKAGDEQKATGSAHCAPDYFRVQESQCPRL